MVRPLTICSIAALAALFLFAGIGAAGDADADAGTDADAGKVAYETNCSACHGLTGKGDGPVAAALNPKPRDFSTGEFKLDANKSGSPGEDEDLKLVIHNGAMSYGGSPLMAGWPTLDDAQTDQIIAYIRSLAAK